MSKRSNPFTEDFIPQSKVYVSLKRFNNNEEKLGKVYENTLQLLFNGAKKTHVHINSLNIAQESRKDGLKQLVIGKNGSLQDSTPMVQQKKQVANCNCGNLKQDVCYYCEENLCSACIKHCMLCLQLYCIKCTLPKFEDSEICYSCYR